LGGDDEMDADCPRHLGDANYGLLYFPPRNHHQIIQFVDDYDEIREAVETFFG
jgi:hypothetical protein